MREYWEREPRAEQPLKAWYAIATNADWTSPVDVKGAYGNASIVGNDRVAFNIGGNRYRLIVRFDYASRVGFVRFVGTHVEYDALVALVEAYEARHWPIEAPDPISALEHVMEARELRQKDLGQLIGSQSHASEILNRRRPLTLGMIRSLSAEWGIPAYVLVSAYELATTA